MWRNTPRVLVLCSMAAIGLTAWLLSGCGGHSDDGGRTGALTMHITWPPAAPAGLTPAAIPAATQCIQLALSQGDWRKTVAVKRPTGDTTSEVSVTDVPIGTVHLHVGAHDNFTEDPDGTVHATGNLLAWAVTDVPVLPNQTATVNVTLGTTPARVVVSAGEASTILNVENTLHLTATAYDGEDNVLLVAGFTWTTSANAIASVDTSGVVTANFPGQAAITATVAGVGGSLNVRVRGWELWDEAPSAGSYSTIVHHDRIYCFGPHAPLVATKKWYVYTPATKDWAPATDLPVARYAPALGVIGGKIYLAENYDYTVNKTYEIDPDTLTVTERTAMPTGVYGPAATVFGGKLWLIGGETGLSGPTAAVQTYDPGTDTWASKNDFSVAGALGSAAVFGGDMYVCGVGSFGLPTNVVYRYDAANDTWLTTPPPLNTARTAMSLGLGFGHLLAAGGSISVGSLGTTTVEAFNGTVWQPAPPIPEPLIIWNSNAQATVDDYLYVIGGTHDYTDRGHVYRLWVGDGAL